MVRLVLPMLLLRACSGAAVPRESAYCDMAAAALRAMVKSYAEQPFGLEDACVNERAMAAGKIHVDARFNDGKDLEHVPERTCLRDGYVIRFDFENFQPSPSREVVLLHVYEPTPAGRQFYAQMEDADWPRKRPGVIALSQCGTAFGVLRRQPAGWTAIVTPPPRDPDAL